MRRSKNGWKVSGAALCVLTLALCAALISSCYTYDSQVDAVIERSQVSADREDMTTQLTLLRDNMKALGWDRGHFAVVWKTPENDLGLHYRAVERLIERLDGIGHLSKSDVAYQTALDDIRGTIREIPNPGMPMLWVKYWWATILLVVLWIVWWIVVVRH